MKDGIDSIINLFVHFSFIIDGLHFLFHTFGASQGWEGFSSSSFFLLPLLFFFEFKATLGANRYRWAAYKGVALGDLRLFSWARPLWLGGRRSRLMIPHEPLKRVREYGKIASFVVSPVFPCHFPMSSRFCASISPEDHHWLSHEATVTMA